MNYLTTNPKAPPSQLEYHLINVGLELVRKNHHLVLIESYLAEVIDEWKRTRTKYAHTKTRMYHRRQAGSPEQLECLNGEGQLVFTIK